MPPLLLPYPQKFLVCRKYVRTRPPGHFDRDQSLLLASLRRQATLGPASKHPKMSPVGGWFSSAPAPTKTSSEGGAAAGSDDTGTRGDSDVTYHCVHDGTDSEDAEPSLPFVVSRDEWDAWSSFASMEQLEAMRLFVRACEQADGEAWHEQDPRVAQWINEENDRMLAEAEAAAAGTGEQTAAAPATDAPAAPSTSSSSAVVNSNANLVGAHTSSPGRRTPRPKDTPTTASNIGGALVPLPMPGAAAHVERFRFGTSLRQDEHRRVPPGTPSRAAPVSPGGRTQQPASHRGHEQQNGRGGAPSHSQHRPAASGNAMDLASENASLRSRVAELEAEVTRLRSTIVHLTTGGAPDGLPAGKQEEYTHAVQMALSSAARPAQILRSSGPAPQGHSPRPHGQGTSQNHRWRWLSAIVSLLWGEDDARPGHETPPALPGTGGTRSLAQNQRVADRGTPSIDTNQIPRPSSNAAPHLPPPSQGGSGHHHQASDSVV